MTIAGQPDGVEGLATGNVAGDSEVHHVKVSKFTNPQLRRLPL